MPILGVEAASHGSSLIVIIATVIATVLAVVAAWRSARRLVRLNAAAAVSDLLVEKDRIIASNEQSIESLDARVRTLVSDLRGASGKISVMEAQIAKLQEQLGQSEERYQELRQYAAPEAFSRLQDAIVGLSTKMDDAIIQLTTIARRDFSIRNASILEASPDGLFLVYLSSGNIEYVNNNGAQMFGYTPEEITDRPLDKLIPEDLRNSHRQYRRWYAEHPQPKLMGERAMSLLGLHQDGHEFPVEIALTPVDDARVWATVRDATPRGRRKDDADESAPTETAAETV